MKLLNDFLKQNSNTAIVINKILASKSEQYQNSIKFTIVSFLNKASEIMNTKDIVTIFENIKTQTVIEYLDSLKKNEDNKVKNANTINIYMGTLNLIFQELSNDKIIATNPFSFWKPLRQQQSNISKVIPDSVLNLILKPLQNAKELSFNEHRNRILTLIMLVTSIRISEALNMRWSDVKDYQNKKIFTVTGKGNKEITRVIPQKTFFKLSEFRDKYNASDYVFYTYGGRLTERSFQLWIKQFGENYTPHCLRHTAATKYYAFSKDIMKTSKQLGHSNISTTQRYVEETDRLNNELSENIEKEFLI